MIQIEAHKTELSTNGYTTIENIYTDEEVEFILLAIDQVDKTKETFRKSSDLFAIRQFFKEVPQAIDLVFTDKVKNLLIQLFGGNYFVVKSIYFDKPQTSNWYVAYHQDLTISVDKKIELEGFGSWTVKQNQYAVQPPIEVLEGIITIRIHFDDTNELKNTKKTKDVQFIKAILLTLNEKHLEAIEYFEKVKDEYSSDDFFNGNYALSLYEIGILNNDKKMLEKAKKHFRKIKNKENLTDTIIAKFKN